jgi:hypothetical protein
MDLRDFRGMAAHLMYQHGLIDWTIEFDRSKVRAGLCNHNLKVLSFSAGLMSLYNEKEARYTVLHEIAHALVGHSHGHDYVWRRKCIEIGGTGEQYVSREAPKVPYKWIGVCPNGHETKRHRLNSGSRGGSCNRCSSTFDKRFLIKWKEVSYA